jgi:dTDP-4-amino-4,6-dideoxygalactose transaminase
MVPFFKKTMLSDELKDLSSWYSEPYDVRLNVQDYFKRNFGLHRFYTTKSCTQSLEIAFMSIMPSERDEVILPSYAFVSLANAISINGFKCVFVDCQASTMNIDPYAIEAAITPKTKAIVTINYGGVSCDYESILRICKKHDVLLIEDNAHGIRAKYKGDWLGTFGDISTISFDYLKNISCNEGGGIALNNEHLLASFERAYNFGTNKVAFTRKETSFYEWKGLGTNAAMAEHLNVVLQTQLLSSDQIVNTFIESWNKYQNHLAALQNDGLIELPAIPDDCITNGHMFWIKVKDAPERSELIKYLSDNGIQTAFHYTPLHSSEFGLKVGKFAGEDIFTTKESSRLLRLPLYYSISDHEIEQVSDKIKSFFHF